ncbi:MULTISPECIES: lasso peptide biosynthesis B2 protein [unclassified Streptomyces]|uniref:lasso peptide biosynthesis B2 protein n=1 Tax=unclassified Streptomyces TaxID=2593676 RepID=UPI001F0F7775|nr:MULTISPECIES: lasso peptide biosynthesis B2 protein [unclassified Streptomyces]
MSSMEAYSTSRTGSTVERAAAVVGFAAALVLLRFPFRRTARAVRIARWLGRRPVAPARAEAVVEAVRHAARWWPGRAACLETSLSAVLAVALLGGRLDWCVGARFVPPPVEYHAWVELPGHGPVGEYTAGGWHHLPALKI